MYLALRFFYTRNYSLVVLFTPDFPDRVQVLLQHRKETPILVVISMVRAVLSVCGISGHTAPTAVHRSTFIEQNQFLKYFKHFIVANCYIGEQYLCSIFIYLLKAMTVC